MTNLDKLKDLLAELFMLDQADLDFGIYRVMNAKRAEITRFLDNDLLPQVRATLATVDTGDRTALEAEKAKAIATLQGAGLNREQAEQTPKIKDLQAKIDAHANPADLENEVLSDLANFFRRYYQGGDFLALRRYKAGVYAIPYEGEEVKLHWANADQYYIKTSEYLRDYTFKLADGRRAHFKLVEADTEADNKKATNGQERRFILCAADPLLEADGELVIRFEYRPDADKRKQGELNTLAAQQIFGGGKPALTPALSPGERENRSPASDNSGAAGSPDAARVSPSPPAAGGEGRGGVGRSLSAGKSFTLWLADLAAKAPTEKNPNRTVLDKHLADYTARNSFDYFIHKDLGGFLRRELDFYIKNEIMHLDDIETEAAPRVEQYLAKIKAIRAIARKVIAFLEQLENFQKKLWLKKKFVVETQWCVTMDRVAESLYPEIAANEAQRAEWVRLFAIDEICRSRGNETQTSKPAKEKKIPAAELGLDVQPGTSGATGKKLETPHVVSYSVPLTVEFLQANPFLVLDTKFFLDEFKAKLLADNKILGGAATLDEATDGLLIHSENFHALNLLQARYREQVKCIYIDPPYNTGGDGFPYKDNYQHSSWLSMFFDRGQLAHKLLSDGGTMFTSIDDKEYSRLAEMSAAIFNGSPEATIIRVNPSTKSWAQYVSTTHDYCLLNVKHQSENTPVANWAIKKPFVDEFKRRTKALLAMKLTDDEKRQNLRELTKIPMFKAFDHYTEFDSRGVYRSGNPNRTLQSPGAKTFPNVKLIHKNTGKPCKLSSSWRFDQTKTDELAHDDRFHFGSDETTVPGVKNYLHEYEEMTPQSVMFDDTQVDTKTIFPGLGIDFDFPKPISFVKRIFEMALPKSDVCVDFFGGSGTTGHAVINLNREDGGKRKYILVEMGDYFDTVLKPRIQKVIYSKDWKDGKPVSREGSSHLFKYLRLESYEDALNNLELRRTPDQDDLLREHAPLREDYMLRYQLDVETRDSASLLNLAQFNSPFAYQLKIATGSVGESRPVNVDLIETFNYLLGLRVSHTDTFIFEAEPDGHKKSQKAQKETGRDEAASLSALSAFSAVKKIAVVAGLNPSGEKVLVIWRNALAVTNADLDAFFQKQGYNTKDMEFAVIYVNGDNNLENLKRADETWKVRRTEDEFKRLMFDVADV